MSINVCHFTLAFQETSNQIILNEAPKFNDNGTFQRASQSMFKIFFYDLAMNRTITNFLLFSL